MCNELREFLNFITVVMGANLILTAWIIVFKK